LFPADRAVNRGGYWIVCVPGTAETELFSSPRLRDETVFAFRFGRTVGRGGLDNDWVTRSTHPPRLRQSDEHRDETADDEGQRSNHGTKPSREASTRNQQPGVTE
jgi:hypothetical protein